MSKHGVEEDEFVDVMPTGMQREPDLDLMKDVSNFEAIKKDMLIARMKGHQNDEEIRRYYSEIGAKMGAMVIVVEGESWEWNSVKYENKAFLGYFFKATEIAGGYMRIQFTTMDGALTRNRRWKGKWTEHPLSSRRDGYIVPKKGGFQVYNNGELVLLSKYGLLVGKSAWQYADWARDTYYKEAKRVERLQQEIEDKNAQLEATESEMMQLQVESNALRYTMKDIKRSYIVAQGAINALEAMKEGLLSDIQMLSEVDTHRRMGLSKRLTDVMKAIEDIRMVTSIQRIDDSLNAGMSEHPGITENMKKRIMEEWSRTGITGKDSQDKRIEELEQRMQEIDEENQRRGSAEERQEQPPPRPRPAPRQQEPEDVGNGGDDNGDEGGGEDAPEGSGGTAEDDKGDGGAGGGSESGGSQEVGGEGKPSGEGDKNVSGDVGLGQKIRSAAGSFKDKLVGKDSK
jgi:hypothetical protein